MALQQTTKALADPIRRQILNLLKKGPMTAGDINSNFDVTFASISRHLSVLKEADLIRDRRDGKFIYYELFFIKSMDFFLIMSDNCNNLYNTLVT